MSELSNRNGLTQTRTASHGLLKPSEVPLPEGMAEELVLMMAQVKARYPNQTMLDLTADMYLAEWEEMALKYGLETLRGALLTVLRESQFFPDPATIREACAARSYHDSMRESGRRAVREHDERVAAWTRERAESNGTA